jgi:tetratricopeptide (TPR) repeat protein
MLKPLSPTDLRTLQQVHAALQSGDRMRALDGFDALPGTTQDHPSGLLLKGMILQAFGKLPEARQAFEAAVEASRTFPQAWNALGNLLDDLGEGAAAVDALQKATELAPENNDFWINLGIAAVNAERFAVAEDALGRAIRAAPGVARGWSAMALLEKTRGNREVAAQLYARAIELDPEDVRSRHNLAAMLREDDEPVKALEQAEAGLRSGTALAETAALRGHLLADLGRTDEAVAAYRHLLDQVPELIDAHETLAMLLPQIGRASEALDSYRAALNARPQSVMLWGSALRTAFSLHDYAQLASWSEQAERQIGRRPEVLVARGAALSRLGQHTDAVRTLREVLDTAPDHASAHSHLAHALLASNDAKGAETHALAATRLDPQDQAPWALLTIIWRVLNDTREKWLADYDRLVMPIDLDAAPGFFDELAERLTAMHTMREHPAEQSLRGGTQTRGNLFERKDPLVQRLIAQIRTGVTNRLRELPDDPRHPFLSRKTRGIAFAGSWSVRLRSEGFHISHIHQRGWMSSALYVSLPPEVGQGEAGALAFGVPDAALGLDLPPRRVERPQVGRLVIFPSFLWHGTLPFESEQPRLTVAFDALPA